MYLVVVRVYRWCCRLCFGNVCVCIEQRCATGVGVVTDVYVSIVGVYIELHDVYLLLCIVGCQCCCIQYGV